MLGKAGSSYDVLRMVSRSVRVVHRLSFNCWLDGELVIHRHCREAVDDSHAMPSINVAALLMRYFGQFFTSIIAGAVILNPSGIYSAV